MSLKEIKERHEALINWRLFEGYTVEAMISLINTLHKDRGELISMVEELQERVNKIAEFFPVCGEVQCTEQYQKIQAAIKGEDDLQKHLKEWDKQDELSREDDL